jgi:hypothetical protein
MSKLGERTKYNADWVTPREETLKYTLKRLNDGLTHTGYKVQYVEWNEDETAKESYDNIQVGRSLILDPRFNYTWLTTVITEIVEQREGYIKFATKNSTYELTTK